MSKKNETEFLVITLSVIFAFVGVLYWLIANNQGVNLGFNNNQSPPIPSSPETSSQAETFTSVQNVPSGLFSYGGSASWAPIDKEVNPVIENAVPQFQLRYTSSLKNSPNSTVGIEMLLNDQLSFAQSSRPIQDREYEIAQKHGFSLQEIPVAIDGIAVAVNPKLDIPGLTLTQLKDIYMGKITNWKELGGPDLAIAAYSRESKAATTDFFRDNILQTQKFGDKTQFIDTTTEGLTKVAANSGGIFYASAPEVVGQCGVKTLPIGRTSTQLVPPYKEPLIKASQCPQQRNRINIEAFKNDQYPMTRYLFVIVKQNNRVAEKAGMAYANLLLSEQGQKLVSQAGFVRIR